MRKLKTSLVYPKQKDEEFEDEHERVSPARLGLEIGGVKLTRFLPKRDYGKQF
jgi:hypothetical protein